MNIRTPYNIRTRGGNTKQRRAYTMHYHRYNYYQYTFDTAAVF